MDHRDVDYDEYDEPEMATDEENYDFFNEMYIRDKNKLIGEMEFHRDQIKRKAETDREHTAAYYLVLVKLFDNLIEKTENTKLFNALEDWWTYSYSISSEGGKVQLDYYQWVQYSKEGDMVSGLPIQSFDVVNIPCRLLTVEEYARLYRVETGTVRQWIRRGKIRTAKKFGREWRIPELTDVPQRGYKMGNYVWSEVLTDVPDCYAFLKDPALVGLWQDPNDPNLFHMRVSRKDESTDYNLSTQEREKLELFLIGHPLVEYVVKVDEFG